MNHLFPFFLYCLLICIIAINILQPIYAQPESTFNAYLQALISEDWQRAEGYWLSEEIQASRRLGIAYAGIKAKYDCASPLVNALESIRRGGVKVTVTDTVKHNDWTQISVQLTTTGESVRIPYYLVKSDGGWKLASSLFVHARNWKRHDTQYATIRFNDASLINEYALKEFDGFVALMGEHLGISTADMERLAEEKIDYYLCNKEEIKELTGFFTHGMTNLQFDAVISRHLPHYHEVVHLLVNYALRELPLYTLPCLQEGVAVCCGGRWGKSPQVLFQLAHFTLAQKMFQLEDVLTYDGFHKTVGNPVFSYPLCGMFVKFLIEQFGVARFKLLYQKLSGTAADVRAFSLADVQSNIAEIYETPWGEIQGKFTGYWKQFEFSGLVPGCSPSHKPMAIMKSAHLSAQIWDSEDAYLFEIKATTDAPNGVILMKDKSSSKTENYKSRLFTEYLPNARYDGAIYGVQFSANEVGLYNYYTNNLMAKYILSFSPSNEYWQSEEKIIRFRLAKAVLNRKMSDFELRLAEP